MDFAQDFLAARAVKTVGSHAIDTDAVRAALGYDLVDYYGGLSAGWVH